MSFSCKRLRPALRRTAGVVLCSLGLLAYSGTLGAQDYPNRPITLVVPFTPGTGYDLIARVVGTELSKELGGAVVVDNRPGASGIIGARSVARSAADGYTLLMIGEGILAAPYLSASNNFDAVAELTPIVLAGYGTLLLTASVQSGFKSVSDLVTAAKAAPGKINYASPGVGTTMNIRMEQFANLAGIKLQHIPYRGSAGALNDVLSGQVEIALIPIHQAEEHLKVGKLVPLAVISPTRNDRAPNVPTLTESGIEGVQARMWYAFAGPRGLPASIQSRLNSEIKNILSTPDVRTRLEKAGLEISTSTPDGLENIMRAEAKSIAPVIRDLGITVN
jgi:tripartite-type tricarboxylate transporter receptor subunit TctC